MSESNENELIENDQELILTKRNRSVRSEKKDPTIQNLYDDYKGGDLVLHPPYQRNFVWDKKKASNLIESILLDIPIPIIFTSQEGEKEEVIDGQQRLKSIFSFIDGKIPIDGVEKTFNLSKLKILKELSGKTFLELDKSLIKKIKRHPLIIVKIISDSDEEDEISIKFEMFERLNTNITKLNVQELRNCMFRGDYNNFLKDMAGLKEFQSIINRPTYSKRMLDVELVLLFFTFYRKNYIHFKGNLKQMMNSNMREHLNIPKNEKKELEKQFKKSISIIYSIFGDKSFRIFSLDNKTKQGTFDNRKLNVGLYQVLMYWFTPYEKNQIVPYYDLIREEMINLLIHNTEFKESLTGSGTNSKKNIITKFEIWGETIKGILGYPTHEPRCFSFKLKEQLFKKDPTCQECSQRINSIDDAEVDHILCYWKGGKTIPENANLTHRVCNRLKGGDIHR